MGTSRRNTETEVRRLEQALAGMTRSRAAVRSRRGVVRAVVAAGGVGDWGDTPRYVKHIAFACRLCADPVSLEAFGRLVLHADAHAGKLLRRRIAGTRHTAVFDLLALAARHSEWRRPPECWRPTKGTVEEQYRRLSMHLLGPAPRLAPAALTLRPPGEALLAGLTGVSLGTSILTPGPRRLALTRRTRSITFDATRLIDPVRAMRLAQALAAGASESLCRTIEHSPLGSQLWSIEDEEWWDRGVRWLARQDALDPDWIPHMVAYTEARRFGDPVRGMPPDPEFELTARKAGTLLEAASSWLAARSWATEVRSRFPPTQLQTNPWVGRLGSTPTEWTLEPILDPLSLLREAEKQHHCAASYLPRLMKGSTTLWSLKINRAGVVRRTLTIEVEPRTRVIRQCRGKANRVPTDEEMRVVRAWAHDSALILPRSWLPT